MVNQDLYTDVQSCTVIPMTQTSTSLKVTIETQPTENVIVRTAWFPDGGHGNAVYVDGIRQRGSSDAFVQKRPGCSEWTAPKPEGEFWQIFIQRGPYADNTDDLTTGILYPSIDAARAEKDSPTMERAAAGRPVRIVRVSR